MRNCVSLIVVLSVVLLASTAKPSAQAQQTSAAGQSAPAPQSPAQQAPPSGNAPPAPPPAAPVAPQAGTAPPAALQPAYSGPVIVLDAAHGGTDSGARGQNGIVEKDIVLQFARVARAELVRQGYKVVLTRDGDSNPSYDDRAALANSYRDAIFLSIHVSSTGTPGSARAYHYQFWKPLPPAAAQQASPADATVPTALAAPVSTTMLTPWTQAQRQYTDASQQLADQLQVQMASAFSGSPGASSGAEIRGLRSIAAPAVAIEISSVAVSQARSLTVYAGPLAGAIAKGVQAFRPLGAAGAR